MQLEVERGSLDRVRVLDIPTPVASDGEAVIQVDAFALTANNITYAVFGDAMQYWQFFPAEPPWGRIPVWGFGTVVDSAAGGLAVGERLYGYYPMGSHLVVQPDRGDANGIRDTAAHRQPMAAAYNRYAVWRGGPDLPAPEREDQQMLLYPLFFTTFLIDDFLSDQDDFGAEQVIVSSASSKTSIGVAHEVHQRGRRVVGLTSAPHRAFVEGLGVYDEVVTYDGIDGLAAVPSAFVDIAGNADVRHAVHTRLGDRLGHSMAVGATHWDHEASPSAADLPGPAPAFFFAPTQMSKRSKEWGPDVLDERVAAAWLAYSAWTDAWLEVHHVAGAEAVQAAYLDVLAGRTDPRHGLVCTLVDGAA